MPRRKRGSSSFSEPPTWIGCLLLPGREHGQHCWSEVRRAGRRASCGGMICSSLVTTRSAVTLASWLPRMGHISCAHRPDATVMNGSHLDSGVVVMAQAVVSYNARIGRGVIINTGAIVEHDCIIGQLRPI